MNHPLNPGTNKQSNIPTVVQGWGGGGGDRTLAISLSHVAVLLKKFYLQWKAFHLLDKIWNILRVVALLEACGVTKHGRHLGCHLGFYQELEIK